MLAQSSGENTSVSSAEMSEMKDGVYMYLIMSLKEEILEIAGQA